MTRSRWDFHAVRRGIFVDHPPKTFASSVRSGIFRSLRTALPCRSSGSSEEMIGSRSTTISHLRCWWWVTGKYLASWTAGASAARPRFGRAFKFSDASRQAKATSPLPLFGAVHDAVATGGPVRSSSSIWAEACSPLKNSSRQSAGNLISLPHGETAVFTWWHHVGLPGALCVRTPAHSHVVAVEIVNAKRSAPRNAGGATIGWCRTWNRECPRCRRLFPLATTRRQTAHFRN